VENIAQTGDNICPDHLLGKYRTIRACYWTVSKIHLIPCFLQRLWLRWIWIVSGLLPFWRHPEIYITLAAMNVVFAMPGKLLQKPSNQYLIIVMPASAIRFGSAYVIMLTVYSATLQHYRIESDSCCFPGRTVEVRVTKWFFSHILNISSSSTDETSSRDVPLTTMLTLPTWVFCSELYLRWMMDMMDSSSYMDAQDCAWRLGQNIPVSFLWQTWGRASTTI
jgi:hypothetical protein